MEECEESVKAKQTSPPTVRVPPVDECLQIMEDHAMMPNIRRHSLMVARVAAVMGEALNRKGSNLDIALIIAGALLHDIAKTQSLREGGNHVEMGQRIVSEMGYPEVAWIVGSHVDAGPEIARSIDEATVVNYADKRVQHERLVSLGERLRDLVMRYGKTPEKRARLDEMCGNIESLEKQIFARISLQPDELEVMIQRAPPIALPEEAGLRVGTAEGPKRKGKRKG